MTAAHADCCWGITSLHHVTAANGCWGIISFYPGTVAHAENYWELHHSSMSQKHIQRVTGNCITIHRSAAHADGWCSDILLYLVQKHIQMVTVVLYYYIMCQQHTWLVTMELCHYTVCQKHTDGCATASMHKQVNEHTVIYHDIITQHIRQYIITVIAQSSTITWHSMWHSNHVEYFNFSW